MSQKSAIETSREIQEPSSLEQLLKLAYSKRLSAVKSQLSRASIYFTALIFITKIISLLVLEIILSKIVTGHFSKMIMVADVLLPTFLMFILVFTIKPPSNKNLNLVIIEAMKIVYPNEKIDIYEIKMNKKRGVVTRLITTLIYLLGACTSFGFIFWVFYFFKFPISSIILNFIFIALILFAGIAVKKRAQELTIENDREGFLSFLSDILFLPFAWVGRWLSNKWQKYNAISAFFNALIDMPFSIFVEFLERWRYFIKERKEEIR